MSAAGRAAGEMPARRATVWFGVLGGMTAWALHLGVSYAVVPYVCGTGEVWVLHTLTGGLAAVAAAGVIAGWRANRRLSGWLREAGVIEGAGEPRARSGPGPARQPDPGSGPGPAVKAALAATPPRVALARRYNFLAISGVLLSGFFLSLILAEGLPLLLLAEPCRAVPTMDRPIVLGALALAGGAGLRFGGRGGRGGCGGCGCPGRRDRRAACSGGGGRGGRGSRGTRDSAVIDSDRRRGRASFAMRSAGRAVARDRGSYGRRLPRAFGLVVAAPATLLLAVLLRPTPLAAHGRWPGPGEVWGAWNLDPWLSGVLLLAALLYTRGVRALWRRAGSGKGIARWRAGAYLGGIGALILALISPIDTLGEALFSVHMVQHLLLMVVAAPLLAIGRPGVAFLWSLPRSWRVALGGWWRRSRAGRVGWRALTLPATILLLHVGALWIWHVPRLYEAALESRAVHHIEHASFFLSALLFWWVLARAGGRGRWPGYGAGVLYVFATALQSGALGALIMFAPRPWYTAHAPGAEAWGMDLLVDQQLAGVLMWVPAGLIYAAAAVALFMALLRESDRRTTWRERAGAGWTVSEAPAPAASRGGRP